MAKLILQTQVSIDAQHRFARSIVEVEKVAFRRSAGGDTGWPNTRYATRPLRDEVTALKREAGTDLIAWGGSEFARSDAKAYPCGVTVQRYTAQPDNTSHANRDRNG